MKKSCDVVKFRGWKLCAYIQSYVYISMFFKLMVSQKRQTKPQKNFEIFKVQTEEFGWEY